MAVARKFRVIRISVDCALPLTRKSHAVSFMSLCRHRSAVPALLCLTLSACGGSGSDEDSNSATPPPPAPPATTYTVSGSVTGLTGTGLTLRLNATESKAISADGPFTFATALNSGATYTVDTTAQPSSPTQNCALTNGSGTIASSNVTNVTVTCTTPASPPAGSGADPGPDAEGRVTSTMLLSQALANGTITQEQQILYSVYSEFGDSRLPPQYKGDDTAILEPNSLTDAAEYFASIGIDHVSPATVDAIRPYFIPPYYEGSAWQTSAAAQSRMRIQAAAANPTKTGWTAVAGTNVVVWYRNSNAATDATVAATLLSEFENTIWPKLTTLMGRLPKSDLGTDGLLGSGVGFTEDDGRLDVFLDELSSGEGVTIPLTATLGGRTKNVPARIFLKRTLPAHGLLAQAAHEFMHAIQYSYDMSGPGLNHYLTIKEATATWASHFVYNNGWETKYPKYYLGRANHLLSYDARPAEKEFHYGAYVFPLYLETKFGTDIVRKIWEATLTQSEEMTALDSAITAAGSSFREQWPRFIAAAWNQETLEKLEPFGVTEKPVAVTITDAKLSGGFTYIGHAVNLPHASMVYHRIDFPDAAVRSITFINGINYALDIVDEGVGNMLQFTGLSANRRRGVSMQIYLKVNGAWQTTPTDFTNLPLYNVCRDDPAGKIESAVFMYGNAETLETLPNYQNLEPQMERPGLFATNIGCRDWTGSMNLTRALDGGRDGTETMKITGITLKNVMPTAAPPEGDQEEPYALAENEYAPAGFGYVYAPTSGTATWAYHGTSPGPSAVCQYDGTKTFDIVGAGRPVAVFTNWTPPGTAFRGANIGALLANSLPQLATLSIDWSCVDSDGKRTTGTEGPADVLDIVSEIRNGAKLDANGLSIGGTGAQSITEHVTGTWSFTGKTQ